MKVLYAVLLAAPVGSGRRLRRNPGLRDSGLERGGRREAEGRHGSLRKPRQRGVRLPQGAARQRQDRLRAGEQPHGLTPARTFGKYSSGLSPAVAVSTLPLRRGKPCVHSSWVASQSRFARAVEGPARSQARIRTRAPGPAAGRRSVSPSPPPATGWGPAPGPAAPGGAPAPSRRGGRAPSPRVRRSGGRPRAGGSP